MNPAMLGHQSQDTAAHQTIPLYSLTLCKPMGISYKQ